MELFLNRIFATLAAGIDDVTTTLPLTTGHGARFGTIGSGNKVRIVFLDAANNVSEVAYMTAITGDTATITRAQDGSTAVAHLAGDRIDARVGKITLEGMLQVAMIHEATSKATPVDADELPLADSAATFGLKKLTWANLKTALQADGWVSDPNTWTCTTAGVAGSLNADGSQNVAPVAAVFTVPGDQTATFGKGVKLKFTQTTVKYGYVKSATYSAPDTTVTLMGNMDYQMVVAAITLNKFSFGAPGDFPKEFAYLNPFIPTTGAPTTIVPLGKFTMFGGQVRAHMDTTLTNIGTCVSYLFSLPIAALNSNVNGSGNEIAVAGHMVSIRPYTANSALVYPFKYDGTFLITNGYRIVASVVYTPV